MIFRDILTKQTLTKTPDGMGGFTYQISSTENINCKVSINTTPEEMTEYGTHGEDILYISSLIPLTNNAYYVYNNKKFTLRRSTHHSRVYYSVLIEIK